MSYSKGYEARRSNIPLKLRLPKEVVEEIKRRADLQSVAVSKYVAELVLGESEFEEEPEEAPL